MEIKIVFNNQSINLSNKVLKNRKEAILSSNLILLGSKKSYEKRKLQYINNEVKGITIRKCFEEYIENLALYLLPIDKIIINKEEKIGVYRSNKEKLYLLCILRKDPYNRYRIFFICNKEGNIQIFNDRLLLSINNELKKKGYNKGLLNTLEPAESIKKQYEDLTEQLKSLF